MLVRSIAPAIAVGLLAGCTSVKMVQREGCWMRQTDGFLRGTTEEIGFCTRPQPALAQDRVARMVQECMAQSDHRWQNRALAAWSRGQTVPGQDADGSVAKTCMAEAVAAFSAEAENAALRSRLAELAKERDTLRKQTQDDQRFVQQSSDKMVSALGDAAKKEAPSAVATATSTGTAASTPAQAPPSTTTVVGIAGGSSPPAFVTMPSPVSAAAACPAERRGPSRARSDKAAAAPACPEARGAGAPVEVVGNGQPTLKTSAAPSGQAQ